MTEYITGPLKKVITYFDKLEDKIRGHLSRYPIIYTIIGGVATVLFWRGVWHTADMLQARGGFLGWLFYEPVSLVIVSVILLATGLFVSYFIGDTILMSGLKKEKKIAEKTEKDLREKEAELQQISTVIKDIKKEIEVIKEIVVEEQGHHHPDKTEGKSSVQK